MTWWGQIVRRARADRELEREIRRHIAERVDDLVDGGMSTAEARRTALREFGNPVCCVEDSRSVWLIPWLVSLGQDVRYVLRTIRRQPVFSASVVLILTFGIGLVTALFTVFNATSAPALAGARSVVDRADQASPGDRRSIWHALQPRIPLFPRARALVLPPGVEYRRWQPDRAQGRQRCSRRAVEYVTANYFDALRIGMATGRGFLPEEEDYRTPKEVVVISERVWREYFASDPGLVGSPIRVGNLLATVVGVAERGFAGVRIRGSIRVDVWLPLPTRGIAFNRKFSAAGCVSFDNPRQASGPCIRPAAAGSDRRASQGGARRAQPSVPGPAGDGSARCACAADTRPLSTNYENVRLRLPTQSLMLFALFLVMLLACANAGNLVLAKTVARRDEIAIRLSLGASRSRVARQMITEALVLSLIAGSAALYLAATVPPLLVRLEWTRDRES